MLQVMTKKMMAERKKEGKEEKNKHKPVLVHQLELKRKKRNLANNKRMLLKSNQSREETRCSAKKSSSRHCSNRESSKKKTEMKFSKLNSTILHFLDYRSSLNNWEEKCSIRRNLSKRMLLCNTASYWRIQFSLPKSLKTLFSWLSNLIRILMLLSSPQTFNTLCVSSSRTQSSWSARS